jgi:23S rRNA (uracil1939-C5)-methyltransferase
VTVKIERLGHHGDGIAAGPIFVPLSLPGEEVDGDIVGDRMVSPRIVMPSPDRVRPPCSHFKTCGGCSVQHASDAFVESWKVGIVRAAMDAQGLDAPIRHVVTSPAQSRRRAGLKGKRTKNGAMVGFHARGSDTLIEIPNCQLLAPQIMALMPALQALTVLAASRKAEIGIDVTWSNAGADISLSGVKPLDGPLRIEAAQFTAQHGIARLTWEGDLIAEQRAPVQMFGQTAVVPPAGAFLQATEAGQTGLQAAVLDAIGPARRVIDLFAGCGTFTLPIAENAQVHAVESSPEMLAALDAGWRQGQGLRRVSTEARDLFRRPLLPDELTKTDAIVIDPPRAGAEAQTVEIARSNIPRIAAVSCNPASFARDARILTDAGYVLTWIDVVDQFRWSAHVELAAQFTRGAPR